jgi:hypothetical protein
MKKTMLKLMAVIAIFAFTLTSCGKDSNIPKVGSCTDIKTAEKLGELMTNFFEDRSVENCEIYIGYLKAYVNKCASFLDEDTLEDFNNSIDEIDCSALGDK